MFKVSGCKQSQNPVVYRQRVGGLLNHYSIRCTPAMESGLTGHVWTLRELLAS
jgi:hypothetical protein